MSYLPFPADSAEFEEYVSVMEAMADEADSLPDPEPEGYADLSEINERDDYFESPDDNDWPDYDDEPEDRYLDCMYEDTHEISEYGMDGCCGDF